MNHIPARFRRYIICVGKFVLMAALVLNAVSAGARETPTASDAATNNPTADGDKAWKEVRKATQEPMPPAEWENQKPGREVISKFYTEALHKGADAAKDFYTRFPNHPKAAEARKLEYKLLSMANQRFGDASQTDRLFALQADRMKDPNLSEDERFKLRLDATERFIADLPDTLDQFVKSAQELQKDFPSRREPYELLMMAAQQTDDDTSKKLAEQVIDGAAPDDIKADAKGLLKKIDALGKPLDIQFTALDGREVDVAKLKGKVVLVDFWATWCGPCVAAIPDVKKTYSNFHDKGFDVVGISLDKEKDLLQRFVTENKLDWPQYFDGEVWSNKFSQAYGIHGIPAMWLVDKKGNLRDLNGDKALEEKVKKLLAE